MTKPSSGGTTKHKRNKGKRLKVDCIIRKVILRTNSVDSEKNYIPNLYEMRLN